VEAVIGFQGRCAATSVAPQWVHLFGPERLLFADEPIQAGDAAGMWIILDNPPMVIPTSERPADRKEFEALSPRRGINIAQPGLCHVGGLTQGRRIAGMPHAAMATA
jgi:galactonate dehydratase